MSFCCYILYSKSRDRYYVGYTGDDLEQRIRRHNSQHKGYTGHAGDWQLVYSVFFDDNHSARELEQQIKKRKSRKYIEQLISGSGHPAR